MNWDNRITQLLKVKYPFIQAPMLVVTTPEMVAAASEQSCLGSLPLGYSSTDKALERIRAVRKLTAKPFAVNLFAYQKSESVTRIEPLVLKSYYKKYGVPFYDHIPDQDPYTYYEDLVDLLIEEAIPVVSFHFGMPSAEVIEKLRRNDIVTICTATCVEEAKMIEQSGINIIVAQGTEAGGNKGTFLGGNPQIGLVSLIPQVLDAVRIPVIAAGGMMQSRSIAAALMLGAEGVQMGSLFIRAKESGATPSWKDALVNSTDTSTVLTKAWSGRYGRCIQNSLVGDMPEHEIFPSPIQNYLTNKLREAGRKDDIPDIQSLWAGQSAKYAPDKSTSDILKELIEDTEALLSRPFQFSNSPAHSFSNTNQ